MMPIAPDSFPPETFDQVYRRLLRALRRKKGFGLFFVVQSNYRQVNQIIEQLRRDLPQKKISLLPVKRETQKIYDQIAELREQEGFDILVIRGIEQALYEYEDTKRLSGWSSTEIYTYSWKGVPPILSHLNQQRERFGTDFPCSFVFVVPSFVLNYFIQRAPDFFDWRSGLFHFPLTDEELQINSNKILEHGFKEYFDLTIHERVYRILIIQSLIKENLNSTEATVKLIYEQGLLFWTGGKYNKALTCWNQVIALKPDHYTALYTKGFMSLILERYQEAIHSFDKALKINAEEPTLWDIRGSLLMLIGQDEEGWASWNRLIDIVADKERSISHDNLNKKLANKKNNKNSFNLHERSIYFGTNYSNLWHHRGLALLKIERYEEALISFQKSIEINDNDFVVWRNHGSSLLMLKRYEEALISFQKSIALNSNDFRTWYFYGITLLTLDRYKEALSIFEDIQSSQISLSIFYWVDLLFVSTVRPISIIEKDNSNDDNIQSRNIKSFAMPMKLRVTSQEIQLKNIEKTIYKSEIWHCKGIALFGIERYDEALTNVEEAIRLNPNNYNALNTKGTVLAKLEKDREAIEAFKQAIYIEPKFTSAYDSLSRIYYDQGCCQLAIDNLIRATKTNPRGDSSLWNNLGFLYLIQNKPKKAKSSLNRSLQINANFFYPLFNLGLVHVIDNKIKEAKRLIQKSLTCCNGDNTQEKLYIAIGTIALGQKQDGLQNLQDILSTLTHPSEISVIRGGVLESAEILARYPAQFSGIDQALAMLKQTLQ